MKKILFLCAFIFLISCEDPVPQDYKPSNVVEALLIVNEPIKNIRITKTQSLFDEYKYENAIISDAKVIIFENDRELELQFKKSEKEEETGYFYSDTNYLVKKNTNYKLKIVFPDGQIATGETTTPDTIYWKRSIQKYMQYPKDTINLPPGDSLEWAGKLPQSVFYYFLTISCLDTLNYGIYLNPPTNELNRRTYSIIRDDNSYRERTSFITIPSTKTPLVWSFLKWFGLHSLNVWLPDNNYQLWALQVLMTNKFDERFCSVKGENTFGFFGSASVIRDTSVVLKNQP